MFRSRRKTVHGNAAADAAAFFLTRIRQLPVGAAFDIGKHN